MLGHFEEGLVFNACDFLAAFLVADDALEGDEAANAAGNFAAAREGDFGDGIFRDEDALIHQPPCTGGKRETWSPCFSSWSGPAYSRSMATRVERAAGASLGKRSCRRFIKVWTVAPSGRSSLARSQPAASLK